ncbi:hypothetical protein [Micromonospora sp. NPDC049301]|uniref:hypothetical protein n=1 Tax=Micromonospora sp. NPDC049301 TaxID=3155723 RepID=UPI00341BC368
MIHPIYRERERGRGVTAVPVAGAARAQMALAAAIGIAVLRSSIQLQPLSSATEQDLVGPLRDLVDALLPRR